MTIGEYKKNKKCALGCNRVKMQKGEKNEYIHGTKRVTFVGHVLDWFREIHPKCILKDASITLSLLES